VRKPFKPAIDKTFFQAVSVTKISTIFAIKTKHLIFRQQSRSQMQTNTKYKVTKNIAYMER